jgi:hypothetical protein
MCFEKWVYPQDAELLRNREKFMVEGKTKEGGMKNWFHIFRNHFAPLHLPHNRN